MTKQDAVQKVREEIARLRELADYYHEHSPLDFISAIEKADKLQWALDLLTAGDEELAALPKKWRDGADEYRFDKSGCSTYEENSRYANGLEACADELESVLKGE